jgi:hypothetical protein
MDGYEVDIEKLREAAKAAGSAGEQAGQVRLGDSVTAVTEAMSGSMSAVQAQTLATAWEERLRTWSTDITSFGGNLAASADVYDKDEIAAQKDFNFLGGLLGGFGR